MAVVIDFRAVDRRLLCWFACCYGGANEHLYHKSAPDQRQRKENDSVLPKESENLLRHRKNKVMPDPIKGYTGDYPLCASLVTFCAHRKSPAGGMDKPIQPPVTQNKGGGHPVRPAQIRC